ncbi:MAG: DUF5103 domain-containing protein [Saprospiraceae bacterium]|nr:DUF5103 domain-containing protein [Saprospiraceae bacterium]
MLNQFTLLNLITFFFLISPSILIAQDENLLYENHIYKDNIKSVKLNSNGNYNFGTQNGVLGVKAAQPIVRLGRYQLFFSFDEMGEDAKNYVYTITHCNADWTPSNLTEMDYIDGFQEEDIDEFEYSFNTYSIYTHYNLILPNEDMRFTKSGNYLLKVYEDEDEKELAITRRFMVVEPIMKIFADMVRPAMVNKIKTHHEIDFVVSHEDFEVRNPRTELSATVLQNGRWDNAITEIRPQFTRREEQLFTYQDKIVFPAGKEFRPLDLRSFKYGSLDIQQVNLFNENYEVTLHPDKKRFSQVHLDVFDLNGDFVIENRDNLNFRIRQQNTQNIRDLERTNAELRGQGLDTIAVSFGNPGISYDVINTFEASEHDIRSEYGSVLFTLYSPTEYYDSEVYIFGGLSDWQLKPEFKMVYNPQISSYVCKPELKQGYYDYYYVTVSKKDRKMEIEDTEGSWFETENTYTILLYYRPFGVRYDKLVGVGTFSSRF